MWAWKQDSNQESSMIFGSRLLPWVPTLASLNDGLLSIIWKKCFPPPDWYWSFYLFQQQKKKDPISQGRITFPWESHCCLWRQKLGLFPFSSSVHYINSQERDTILVTSIILNEMKLGHVWKSEDWQYPSLPLCQSNFLFLIFKFLYLIIF